MYTGQPPSGHVVPVQQMSVATPPTGESHPTTATNSSGAETTHPTAPNDLYNSPPKY